ncbi:hypothetical protein ACS3SW_07295 [Roseobacteraceae bacterium S113]
MFQNWGFLLSEMVGLIILAALLGLLAGWLIWGGRRESTGSDQSGEVARLNTALERCQAAQADKDARIATLESDLEEARAGSGDVALDEASAIAAAIETEMPGGPQLSGPDATPDFDGDGVLEGSEEGAKPETLAQARAGGADDLKMIKGIGPKLEQLCNALGFYHFDQIANWTADEVAWVDANLEGFKGRVSRDAWVAQAKILASGGSTEFSERVEDGDVYE